MSNTHTWWTAVINAKSSSAVQRLVSRAEGTMDFVFLERFDFEELDLEGWKKGVGGGGEREKGWV